MPTSRVSLRPEDQKRILKKAEALYDKLVSEHGTTNAKWAFNKILQGQTEKQKLLREKERIESRLREINKKI